MGEADVTGAAGVMSPVLSRLLQASQVRLVPLVSAAVAGAAALTGASGVG